MEDYLKNFDKCIERDIPYCESECPFHMEIFNFMEKVSRGANRAAFKVYRNAVGYPRIANALCHQPCKQVCPRAEHGGAVEMGLLEKASMAYAGDTSATDYNIPTKKERIAIIGAGISGMAALLRLSTKKYYVEVFEKNNSWGGQLRDLMDVQIFNHDFKEQLIHQEFKINYNYEVKNFDDLNSLANERNFNAVYIATGDGGNSFGLANTVGDMGDRNCKKIGNTGYFLGGGVIGKTPVYALANGLHIGTVIDNYLKTGYLYYPENVKKTGLCQSMVKIEYKIIAVKAKNDNIYSKEEAIAEANRCVRCHCDYCSRHCDLIEFTGKWPVRMRDEIVATTLEGKSELKATPAKRLMSLCNQCGICKEVCPKDIDLDGLFMEGRKKMHRQGKAPWVFHDFFLQDMDFSNSEYSSIIEKSGASDFECKNTDGNFVFFPGCQLGASEPDLVKRTYRYLSKVNKHIGLMLMCCGVPAEWSGDEGRHKEELTRVRKAWHKLGEPTLIMACPTCVKKFKEHLSDITIISIYEWLQLYEQGLNGIDYESKDHKSYRIFHACSSRGEENMQMAVRRLAERGCNVENEGNKKLPQCCGYGGHGEIANPKYAAFVAQKRVVESHLPYLTYCINCRDNFKYEGKETLHLLELMFYTKDELRNKQAYLLPTMTERRNNRVKLKQELLKEFWGREMDEVLIQNKKYVVKLKMSKVTEEKLNKERILLEDVAKTIDFCERTQRKVYNEVEQTYSGYMEIGYMTLWVEYKKQNHSEEEEREFEVKNAYSHRMKIELETVWNGKKSEINM